MPFVAETQLNEAVEDDSNSAIVDKMMALTTKDPKPESMVWILTDQMETPDPTADLQDEMTVL